MLLRLSILFLLQWTRAWSFQKKLVQLWAWSFQKKLMHLSLELSEKTHEFELGHFRKNHMPFFSAPSSSSAAAEILHQDSYYLVSPRFLLYESTILHVILWRWRSHKSTPSQQSKTVMKGTPTDYRFEHFACGNGASCMLIGFNEKPWNSSSHHMNTVKSAVHQCCHLWES